jgi:uncharacterized RDD family membrane protein YckC
MPAIKIPTNFNIDVEFEIPEFYKRLIALLIDYLLLFFYTKIANEILRTLYSNSDFGNDNRLLDLRLLSIVFLLPILIYHPLLEITMRGQSIGKKLMKIQVINENGGKASISQLLIRWLVRDIWFLLILSMGLYYNRESNTTGESVFLVTIVLAYFVTDIVLVVSSKKGQRMGDILAKTILIDIRQRGNIEETVFQEVADSYVPSFPQIMHLSDKDINAIKSILETAQKKGDYNMAESAAYKIKAHLKIESTIPPFDFLEILLKDYNFYSTK